MRDKKVLCAVDFSPSSGEAFDEAVIRVKASGGTLLLLHVFDAPPMVSIPELAMDRRLLREEDQDSERKLRELADAARARGVERIQTFAIPGTAWREICDLALREGADLIVVGSHGRSAIMRALVGSVAERVVRHAAASVLVVRAPAMA